MHLSIKLVSLLVVAAYCCPASGQQQQQPQQTNSHKNRPKLSLTPKLKTQKDETNSSTTTTTTNKRERSIAASNATSNSNSQASPRGRIEFVEDELPPDFYEMPPEQLDLGMNATGRAPIPILNVAVLQNGQIIDNAITVHPGTPLEMVVYLDDKSARVYGLLTSRLKVQDDTLRQREELIIQNGCSLDTYIFGNFEPNPEDGSLRAKFRAFKFPDSNFVRFVGTVNVCIKQCAKVNCGAPLGNGGRRRRAASGGARDERLVMTVSTVLRISNLPEINHKL